MTIDRQKLRWNGWGPIDQPNALPDDAAQWSDIQAALGLADLPSTPPVKFADIIMPACHLTQTHTAALCAIVGDNQVRLDDYERAFHARGKSYHDLLYLRAGRLETAPDAVVYPRSADEVLEIIAYCTEHDIALVPFGGGSSVVGGVNAQAKSVDGALITLDMTLMDKLLAVDKVAMTATLQAGIYGPDLEKKLAEQGVTLGHYPQSFDYSTLGGWIAASGAGQQSNRYGRAGAWLVSARLATPQGFWSTKDAPASAAGPNLTQLVAGSEGALGVICEATVRVHAVPEKKDYRGYLCSDFARGADIIRRITQADIPVATLRLSDAAETHFLQILSQTRRPGALKGWLRKLYLKWKGFAQTPCLLLIGLEGDAQSVGWSLEQTTKLCLDAGALKLGARAGNSWYRNRFSAPYVRDPMLDHGLGIDTLETATRWSNLSVLHNTVTAAIADAMQANMPEPTARGPEPAGIVMAHISHSYPDGASLYFTFVFPRQLDREVEQWQAIKRTASDAILAHGGTISPHHGVGTDHVPWAMEEKGEIGLAALQSLKQRLDPQGILNPGKLLP